MTQKDSLKHVASSPLILSKAQKHNSRIHDEDELLPHHTKSFMNKRKKFNLDKMIRDEEVVDSDNSILSPRLSHDGVAITIDSIRTPTPPENTGSSLSLFSRRLKQSNVSVVLERYDDIFSDFDPRHFSERLISRDFVDECRRRITNARQGISDDFSLNLLIPLHIHNSELDQVVIKRMHSYFQYKYHKSSWDLIWFLIKSFVMIVLGISLLTTATVLNVQFSAKIGKWYQIIDQIVQPAAWFVVWSGLDLLFIRTGESGKIAEKNFWKKMSNCNVKFTEYDDGEHQAT